jgi:hypothetical protein
MTWWTHGKAPPIGQLRNFARVYEWQDIPVSGGPSVNPGYAPIGSCWCSLKPRIGEQMLLGAQIDEASGPRGTHIIRTRFRAEWTVRHMLEIARRRYKVVSVNNDDARRFSSLEVEEFGDLTIIAALPPRTIWDEGDSHWDDLRTQWDA